MSKLPFLMNMPRLTPTTLTRPLFSLLHKTPTIQTTPSPHYYHNNKKINNKNNIMFTPHFCTLATPKTTQVQSQPLDSDKPIKKKRTRKANDDYYAPASVLKHKLDQCSKNNTLKEALLLYDEARVNSTPLSLHHYNVLLYLCSNHANDKLSGDHNLGLERGFEIFRQMGVDNVAPNEATFTSLARLAVAKEDPERAFELVKEMRSCGIVPKLRSYGPALYGFCRKGEAERAYEVDRHMVECGVVAEEEELVAVLKVSVTAERGEKVYEMLHRLRGKVRQVSEETVKVVEDWFRSEGAGRVGVEKWDVRKVREGVANGGGGWHGQGWLGKGEWKVVRAEMDKNGVCGSCGEKLVCIDIDPEETENFARSLSSLALKKEKRAHFVRFQDWLRRHGPFDAVVDAANVGLINQRAFNFRQLNNVVNQMQELSPRKRLPLVILHRNRVYGGPAENPNNRRLLDGWANSGALYATPHGSNDDWYWLYAAVNSKCLLVSNDEMRDHLFQLLGDSIFPRWKEKHQVRMTVSRKGLDLHMPPPYSIVIQESERGRWHVPTVTGDDLESPRQWLCASRPIETTRPTTRSTEATPVVKTTIPTTRSTEATPVVKPKLSKLFR